MGILALLASVVACAGIGSLVFGPLSRPHGHSIYAGFGGFVGLGLGLYLHALIVKKRGAADPKDAAQEQT